MLEWEFSYIYCDYNIGKQTYYASTTTEITREKV